MSSRPTRPAKTFKESVKTPAPTVPTSSRVAASSSSSRPPIPDQLPKEIVLRLYSTAGRGRVVLKSNDTLHRLRLKAAEHFNVPGDSVTLHLDAARKQTLVGEDSTLAALHLSNGQEIYVSTLSGAEATMKGVVIDTPKKMTTGDLPEEKTKRPAPATASAPPPPEASSAPSPDPAAPKQPTFQSFDDFLSKRDFNTNDLPLTVSYKPILIEKRGMTKLPASATLKHQPYRHVDHLEFMNVPEVNEFVRYWRYELDMIQQRVGFLYGYYVEDSHYPKGIRAVVEAVYEPPQVTEAGGSGFTLLDDRMAPAVDAIATRLGLECVGWIFTHLPRDQLLMSSEIPMIARQQLSRLSDKHYTGYPVSTFVTCTVVPDPKSGGEPVPNAFMVSDMGMAFYRDGILAENFKDATHLELRQPTNMEVLPHILETGAATTRFDADWFVVRVNESAPKKVGLSFLILVLLYFMQCRSRFAHASFPRENRAVATQPGAIKVYLDKLPSSEPSWQKFSDFHLLIYIATLFDVDTALATCDAIVSKTAIDPTWESTLRSLA